MSSQYQCHCCRETPKSRADWLFHMILDRHSLKARVNFQKWLSEMKLAGDAYVISDLNDVDNSMLLEFLADNLRSFLNIVFFKPEADICVVICDHREMNTFLSRPFPNNLFKGLKFRPYEDYSRVEWDMLFAAAKARGVASPSKRNDAHSSSSSKRKPDEDEDDRYYAKIQRCDFGANAPPPQSSTSKSSSNPFTGYYSSDEDNNDTWDINSRAAPSSSNLPRQNAIRSDHYDESEEQPPRYTENFDGEMETIYQAVMIPKDVRDARKRLMKYLRDTFVSVYPNCDFIPIGADFLGFNLESEYFLIYFDTQGLTHPSTWTDATRVISEEQTDIDKVRTKTFTTLKKIEADGKLTDLKCEGADRIRFNHVIYRIKCRIAFKPFKQAQTARLCKQLFYMNKHVSYLLILVTYWAMQYSGFTARLSCNPYVFNWLIYIFFMLKNSLPPVAELQKCDFKILDGGHNVAFEYDDSFFSENAENSILRKGKSFLMVEKLMEWFVFMDETFSESKTRGVSARHSLVCPKFGELIEKRKFKVCVEHFTPNPNLTSDQKNVRKLWKEDLVRIGFDESTWDLLKDLKLTDTFALQHPLYISDNIGVYFDVPFSAYFFDTIRKTRIKLTDLVRKGSGSLIASL